MIVAIEGIITSLEPTKCILKLNNGISYGIIISLNSSSKLSLNDKVELFITQIIREDANLLYGFLDKFEQKMFEMLLKVSGVGPSSAITICSSLSYNEFFSAMKNGDIKALTLVPGIGVKSAKKILVELSDKVLDTQDSSNYKNEAILALESLGFKKDKISKVLNECKSTNTSDLVKEALKMMM